jgi:hypothetical protein
MSINAPPMAAAHLPAAREKALRLQQKMNRPWRRRSPQAPGQAGGSERVGEGVGQREPEGFRDLHLTEMASWREGDKTRNVHLGSFRKMDAEAARQKARKMKAEALGMRA